MSPNSDLTSLLLVGTDFSSSSDRAFQTACQLAQSTGARIHLLHILEPVDEPDSSDPDTTSFYDSLTEVSRKKLQSQMAQNDLKIPVECSVVVGHRQECLLQAANDMDADMTVLGSVPLTAESRGLGISHRVAVCSSRPVLLVP